MDPRRYAACTRQDPSVIRGGKRSQKEYAEMWEMYTVTRWEEKKEEQWLTRNGNCVVRIRRALLPPSSSGAHFFFMHAPRIHFNSVDVNGEDGKGWERRLSAGETFISRAVEFAFTARRDNLNFVPPPFRSHF